MRRLSLLVALLAGIWPAEAATSNPFPAPIPRGGVLVDVRNFATIPKKSGQIPRIHQLVTAPDGRIFVLDQLGVIYSVSGDGRTVIRYLDVSATAGVSLVTSSEQGLESMAFHPDFLKSGSPGFGKFYTAHTSGNTAPPADYTPGGGQNADDNVILEWRTATPSAAAFAPADSSAPFRELLRVEAPFANHTVGLVAFNPNALPADADYGKLYVGFGDGGSGGDPLNLAQNKTKPHGKILRLDPLGSNGPNGKYGIPSDNPFVGAGGVIPEIWALGFRNPQRFTWDRGGAKNMFIADIGQGTVEEIDIGMPGANYGWSQREGSFVFVDSGSVGANARGDATTSGFTYPIAEYDHDEGNAITAGIVARSAAIPALFGKFLFGDLTRGRVFFIDGDPLPTGGAAAIRELRLRFGATETGFLDAIKKSRPDAERVDLRFGADDAGRIFLLNKQDGIVRVLAAPASLPVVKVAGKSTRTTRSRACRIHGSARASEGLKMVQIRVGPGAFRRTRGTARWHLTIHLREGRNRVTVRAIDKTGRLSPSKKLIVILK